LYQLFHEKAETNFSLMTEYLRQGLQGADALGCFIQRSRIRTRNTYPLSTLRTTTVHGV